MQSNKPYLIIQDGADMIAVPRHEIMYIQISTEVIKVLTRAGFNIYMDIGADNAESVQQQIRDQLAPESNSPTERPRYAVLDIVRIERGETQNSGSPLWRCYTESGEQVNFFKHTAPAKDTYPLLAAAGWGNEFDDMIPGEIRTPSDKLLVTVDQSGKWRTPISVTPHISMVDGIHDNLTADQDTRRAPDILDSAMSNLDTLDRIRGASPLDEDDTEPDPESSHADNSDYIPF